MEDGNVTIGVFDNQQKARQFLERAENSVENISIFCCQNGKNISKLHVVVRYTRNCTFIHHASSDVIGSQRDESQSHCSMHDAYMQFPVYFPTLSTD